MEDHQPLEPEREPDATAPLDSSLVSSILKGDPTSPPLPQEHLPAAPLAQSPSKAIPTETAVAQDMATTKRVPPPLQIPTRMKSNSVSILGPSSHRRGAASVSQFSNRQSLTTPTEEIDPSGSDVEFLTVLASQERRVLELREELHKAEEQLVVLKKKWSAQEATKMHKPIQRMHSMRPATAGGSPRLSALEDEDGSTNWMYQEMQRRKSILSKSARQGHRRIFTGSREIMPLTLVSPMSKRLSAPPLSTSEQEQRESETVSDSNTWSGSRVARSSTMPDFGEPIPEEASERGVGVGGHSMDGNRSHHVRKSTQIVSDFREGLWTFFEDLRQATVGDDARPTKPLTRPPHERSQSLLAQSKRRSSPQAKRKGQRRSGGEPQLQPQPHDDATLIDIGGAFWKEHDLERMGSKRERTPKRSTSGHVRRKTKVPRDVALHTQLYDGETWDTWDTPQKSSPSGAPSSSMSSPGQHSHSTRDCSTRNSSQSSVEAIPTPSKPPVAERETETSESTAWPAFSKRASMLRSSAMQLMDEWERSLNPPESHQGTGPDPAHVG